VIKLALISLEVPEALWFLPKDNGQKREFQDLCGRDERFNLDRGKLVCALMIVKGASFERRAPWNVTETE
jgi:hypothetical protein